MVHKINQTSQKILREAQSGKIFLLDGATGTFLQNNGLEAGGSPELMNIENPSVIEKMANTYYSSGDSPNSTTGNTSTSSADWTTYEAPLENFSSAYPTVCQSISNTIDRTALTLTAYLLDTNGDVVANSGASGNCPGVVDVLGVAQFKSGSEVVITPSTTALTATFTVTDNGMTLYRSEDGNLTMDSGPFNVTFTVE